MPAAGARSETAAARAGPRGAGGAVAGRQQPDAGSEGEERTGGGEGDAARGRRAERQRAVCGSDQRLERQRGDRAGKEVDEHGKRTAAREPERERERQDGGG